MIYNIGGQDLRIERVDKNKVKIKFNYFDENFNDNIRLNCDKDDILNLIDVLEQFVDCDIKKEERAYHEEISTFKDGVERTLLLSGTEGNLSIFLDCYTDIPYDDNWIVLTQSKLIKLIGLMYGYVKKK